MVKILLVGCGYWGKNWYNTIKSSQYELVGVVDPNPVIDVDVPLFKTLDDVNVTYTHAIIATNAIHHLDIRNKLVCKDQNTLVEKPCGLLSNRNNLEHCFPGYIFLSSPQYKYIKNHYDQGLFGDVLYSKFERASMGPRLRTDVDIVEDYAIHDLYLYQAIFNYDEVNISNSLLMNTFKSPIKSDTIFLTLTNKQHQSTFFSSWRHPIKSRRIEIIGNKSSIIWNNDELYVYYNTYNKINGIDSYGNVGYQLIEQPEHQVKLDISVSNLHLQLNDFVEGVSRVKIYKNVNNLIEKIKQYGN